MNRSIGFRIFMVTALLSVFAVLAFAAYTMNAVYSAAYTGLTDGLRRVAETAGTVLDPRMYETGVPGGTVKEMAEKAGVRLTVIGVDGTVLADSEQDPAHMENHKLRPEVSKALAGETGVSIRLSSTLGHDMVYVAVPVIREGKVAGTVRASFSGELFARTNAVLRRDGTVFAAVLLLLCALAAFGFSRFLTAPLRELSATVARFSSGDFSARLLLRRKDEIGNLADTFNSMAERVQTLFSELARRTDELDGVFSSVGQGIAIVDKDGKIIRSNRVFEGLVGQGGIDGKALWEVAHALPLVELAKKVRAEGPQPPEETRIGDRTLLCGVSRVAAGENLIAVLYDTTDVRRVEEVKRDFVVNASHELRTPLTAIQGYLEMLGGEVTGEASRWVEVARRNADRMKAIVEDLLRLSGLESNAAEPSWEAVDVARLISETVELFAAKARDKGLTLRAEAAPGLPRIQADPYLLGQMLANLTDNALKYTEKGGVTLGCVPENAGIRITVEDTGIGIPEEHLSRVFERFYVVDKSRSRKLGGTGLGLSIVKHIVQLHGGSIEVKSLVGKGTRFIIRLSPN